MTLKPRLILKALCMLPLLIAMNGAALAKDDRNSTIGMSLIPAGEFQMGSIEKEAWPEERPAHRVRISRAFWLDQTESTNAQFERFVKATGYQTLAERPVQLDAIMKQLPPGSPIPSKEMLSPGSLVFSMPSGGPVDLRDTSKWWHWTIGASWRVPEGLGSSLKGRAEHPVVHLAWEDAQAFCQWQGKRLPTEAEWERAARGGVDGLPYVWGSTTPEQMNKLGWLANIWQGVFPTQNDATDGFEGTSPVKHYKPNPYGLYDMAGNVWEWVADWYDPRLYVKRIASLKASSALNTSNAISAAANTAVPSQLTTTDPTGPLAPLNQSNLRVQRGGSFLCNDSYCERYRPGARQGAAADSGTSHAGVRCAKTIQ